MLTIRFSNGETNKFDYGSLYLVVATANVKAAHYGLEWVISNERDAVIAKSDGYKLSKEQALKTIAVHLDEIQDIARVFELNHGISIGMFKETAFAFMFDNDGNSVFDISKYGGEWRGLS